MRFLVMSAVAMLLATGCAADRQQQTDEPGVANAQVEAQRWAGELCGAIDALQAQVAGFTESIDIDLAAGLDQLPRVYAQLEGSVARMAAGVDAVETVLREVPASSPEAVAFAEQVERLVRSARSSGEEALVSAEQAVNADNFLGAGVAAAGAVAAAQQARTDAGTALELVHRARTGQDPQLQEAFTAAPECASP